MDLSNIITNIGNGSAEATPSLGSAALDQVAGLPSQLILWVANLVNTLGS